IQRGKILEWLNTEQVQTFDRFSYDKFKTQLPNRDLSTWLTEAGGTRTCTDAVAAVIGKAPGRLFSEPDVVSLTTESFPGFFLQLYKTWLLLLEVLPFEEIIDRAQPFEIRRDRNPEANTVAVRHWYKTACTANLMRPSEGGESAQQIRVPVR